MTPLDDDAPGDVGDVVVLTRILTSYHRSLKKGVQGTVVGGSDLGKDFAKVSFPEITIAILWDSMRPTHEALPVNEVPDDKPPTAVKLKRPPLTKPPKTTVKLFRPQSLVGLAVAKVAAPKAPVALSLLTQTILKRILGRTA